MSLATEPPNPSLERTRTGTRQHGPSRAKVGIVPSRARPPCRCGPLSSKVRRHCGGTNRSRVFFSIAASVSRALFLTR